MRVMSEEVLERVAEYNVAYQREFGKVGISIKSERAMG